jgi:hypothetical protein
VFPLLKVLIAKFKKGALDHEQSFPFSVGWFCIQHDLYRQQSSHAVQGIQNKRSELLKPRTSHNGRGGKLDSLGVCDQPAIWTSVVPTGLLYDGEHIHALLLPAF